MRLEHHTSEVALAVLIALACGAAGVSAQPLPGQADAPDTTTNLSPAPTVPAPSPSRTAAALDKSVETLKSVRATITVGASGTEADRGSEDYRVNAGVDARHGIYPNEFVLATRGEVRLANNSFTEQVATLRMSYDRNMGNSIGNEAFFFLDRMGAQPIGLDARYELGSGIKLEYVASKSGDPILTSFGKALLGHVESLGPKVPTGWTSDALKSSVKEQNATFRFGVATSLMLELQRSTVTAPLYTDSTRTTETGGSIPVVLGGRQVVRMSLRPAITIRPGSRVRLRGEYFFKPALSGGAKKPREDAAIKAEWSPLSEDLTGIKMVVEWNSYFDHDPERTTDADVLKAQQSGQFIRAGVAAGQRYTSFRVSVESTFSI